MSDNIATYWTTMRLCVILPQKPWASRKVPYSATVGLLLTDSFPSAFLSSLPQIVLAFAHSQGSGHVPMNPKQQ